MQFSVFAKLRKPSDETKVSCHASSYSKPVISFLPDDDYFEMVDQIAVFCSSGSGFIIESLERLDINMNLYKPIKRSRYIATPCFLKNNNFLFNIQNKNDNLCFAYSIIAALNPSKSHKKNDFALYRSKLDQLDLKDFEFPMSMADIPGFESKNNVVINVFTLDKKSLTPLFLSKKIENRINLLLLTNGIAFHYCLITNFNAFISRQFNISSDRRKFCTRCLHGFSSQKILVDHLKLCGQHDAVSIKIPEPKLYISFRNWCKTSMSPFTICADTEGLCIKKSVCKTDPSKAGTKLVEEQIPCLFCALLLDRPQKRTVYKSLRGPESIQEFFSWNREQAKNVSFAKQKFKQLNITKEERLTLFAMEKPCVICRKQLKKDKIVHHDHSKGRIYGLAHNECNLKQRTQSFTPVFFHNLSRYDSHHLIRFPSLKPNEKLSVVLCTDEIYISFSLHVPVDSYIDKTRQKKLKYEEMRFLDSLRFLTESLQNLSKTLKNEDFYILRTRFPEDYKSSLLTQKEVYQYFYIDSFENFDERKLPEFGSKWVN